MPTESQWEDRFRILSRDFKGLARILDRERSENKILSNTLHIKQCVIDRLKIELFPLEPVYNYALTNKTHGDQWFIDRIGRIIYRSWDFTDKNCDREDHDHQPVVEILIADKQHATYIAMYEEIYIYRDTPYLALLPQYSESTYLDIFGYNRTLDELPIDSKQKINI